MSLDLSQFHETFFAESFEALDSMEAALLKLSAGESDFELINTIFRVAHSIKGGSATFGFNAVASFTHKLETLLDELRSGNRRADPSMVDTLLRAGDLMREMLAATQAGKPLDTPRVASFNPRSKSSSRAPAVRPRSRRRNAGSIRADDGSADYCRVDDGPPRLAHPLHSRPQTTAPRQRSGAPVARARSLAPCEVTRRRQVGAAARRDRSPKNAACPGASR